MPQNHSPIPASNDWTSAVRTTPSRHAADRLPGQADRPLAGVAARRCENARTPPAAVSPCEYRIATSTIVSRISTTVRPRPPVAAMAQAAADRPYGCTSAVSASGRLPRGLATGRPAARRRRERPHPRRRRAEPFRHEVAHHRGTAPRRIEQRRDRQRERHDEHKQHDERHQHDRERRRPPVRVPAAATAARWRRQSSSPRSSRSEMATASRGFPGAARRSPGRTGRPA